MRGIILIGVILGLVFWAASTVELPSDVSTASIAHQQQTQWRRTAVGWLPLQAWTQEPPYRGTSPEPLTITAFESLLSVLVILAFSQEHPDTA